MNGCFLKSQFNLKTCLRLISNQSQAAFEIDLKESQRDFEIALRSRRVSPLDFEIRFFNIFFGELIRTEDGRHSTISITRCKTGRTMGTLLTGTSQPNAAVPHQHW